MIGSATANGSFHQAIDARLVAQVWRRPNWSPGFTYKFENFFHPFVAELIERLNQESLASLFDPVKNAKLATEFFEAFYTVSNSKTLRVEHFKKVLDLRVGGPYANYNWELLYHFPLAIAVHLSKSQRFAEAQRWFHFIFDPTCNDESVDPPQRYWRFLAFRDAKNPTQIDELLTLLSKKDLSLEDADLRQQILDGYAAIKEDPFQPHRVARTRQLAHQFYVVMKYLDNLIAWGDHLFRQDTVESLNEATQRYVLAANLLGARPQHVPRSGAMRPKTYAELKTAGLDEMGNALVELEAKFPLDLSLPHTKGGDRDISGPLFGIGRSLYFCIPRNEKMLGYWDTVGDRLFKIRNCLNIEGVYRQLALFDPPIDPGMLVKAAAAGIDIGSILSGLNQPVSPLRSLFLIQKALELCSEVRGLGSALLAAIEKGDAEHLAVLRQGHEITIQQMQQDVRFLQWKQAEESTQTLLRGRDSALEQYHYYLRLLDLPPDDTNAPAAFATSDAALATIDVVLTEENFDAAFSLLVGQYDKPLAPGAYPQLDTEDEGRLHLHTGEYDDLNGHADRAIFARTSAGAAEAVAAVLGALPGFNADVHFWGCGLTSKFDLGQTFANAGRATSSGFNIWAQIEEHQGQIASKTSCYTRRADEWMFQANLATLELKQIGRQILGSKIAEQIAYREYLNIKKQIEQSKAVDTALHDKFSNEVLYVWMQGEISRLYFEYYRFAFDTARKAEQTMKRELMRPEVDAVDYVKFNYWDAGRRGLLSGEALYLDVKRMEMAYHENSRQGYYLTKHVSLRQVDPLALVSLRATGQCTVSLPEALFDFDGPGHYCRRIRSVAVSIPCVAGPYTSVNCTLTLLRSSIRTQPALLDGEYERKTDGDDPRFVDRFGSVQSIVTSSGQNDSGASEEREDSKMRPFEGHGLAQSEWRLALPADPSKGEPRQLDYETISDVDLYFGYNALEGGAPLRKAAIDHLKKFIGLASSGNSVQLFSVRHEFPSEWAKFKAVELGGAVTTAALDLELREEHYPFWSRGRLGSASRIDVIAKASVGGLTVTLKTAGQQSQANLDAKIGLLRRGSLEITQPLPPVGKVRLDFDRNKDVEDLFLAVRWGTDA